MKILIRQRDLWFKTLKAGGIAPCQKSQRPWGCSWHPGEPGSRRTWRKLGKKKEKTEINEKWKMKSPSKFKIHRDMWSMKDFDKWFSSINDIQSEVARRICAEEQRKKEKITAGSLAVTLGHLHSPLGLDEPGGGNHLHGLGDLLDVLGRRDAELHWTQKRRKLNNHKKEKKIK